MDCLQMALFLFFLDSRLRGESMSLGHAGGEF